MCNKGWLKKMLPFMATFALGVFIASFFVSVGPRFGFSERRMQHFQEMQRLRIENEELRQENERLKNKFERRMADRWEVGDEMSGPDGEMLSVPPPPPMPAPRIKR